MKVRILTDGGYDNMERCIGKVFFARSVNRECCEVRGSELNVYAGAAEISGFNNGGYYYFLPDEFEVVEE